MDRTLSRAALLLVLTACSGGKGEAAPKSQGIGRRIAGAEARAMLPSADGAWLAWLDGCHVARGQFLPPGTANCDLRVAPTAGGSATKIAAAVTTLPQGFAWSPTGGTLAVLGDYDYGAGSGTLIAWSGGKARELAKDVTFYGFGSHGELGFVTGGKLSILRQGEAEPHPVEGADEGIATFSISPANDEGCGSEADIYRLLARRARAAGGQLLVGGCRLQRAWARAGQVGDYGFSADGRRFAAIVEGREGGELRQSPAFDTAPGSTVGRWVRGFAFAPEGETTAFVADASQGKQGNLYLVEPRHLPPTLVGRDVGQFRWARSAPRLAWLEKYDPRVNSGTLGVGGVGVPTRTFGRNVSDFELSADGRFVAFLQRTTRGGFSVDLGLAAVDGKEPAASVAQGVFGFGFSPDGKWLYYRPRCTRNGEGCDLERVPASGLPKDGKPEPIAQGMKSFEFDPRDPSRLLVGWQRADRPALDIGVWKGGAMVRVDQYVLPGSARFLGPDSRRVGYAVIDAKREGVYAAEVP